MENNQEKYVGKNPGEKIASKPRYPSGYRFAPKDEELIIDYLWNKINDQPIPLDDITQVLLYQHNPQTLADTHPQLGENEWYFFTPRDRKYQNGSRPSRSAGNGYWKATGSDRSIPFEGQIVGFKKSLVFHEGRPPAGKKTNWIMHEYRANLPPRERTDPSDMRLDDWVLCRLYMKSERTNKKRKRNDDNEEEEQLVEDQEEEEEEEEEVEKEEEERVAKDNNKVDNNNVGSTPVSHNATPDNTVTYQHQITDGTAFNNSWTHRRYIQDASHLVYYNQQPDYTHESSFTYLPNQRTSFNSSSMQNHMTFPSYNNLLDDENNLQDTSWDSPSFNHRAYLLEQSHNETAHPPDTQDQENWDSPSFNHPGYLLEQSHNETALPPDTQDQENLRQVSSSLPLSSDVAFVEDPAIFVNLLQVSSSLPLSSDVASVEDPAIFVEDPTLSSGAIFVEDPKIKHEDSSKEDPKILR